MSRLLQWNERTVALAIVLLILALTAYCGHVNAGVSLEGAA